MALKTEVMKIQLSITAINYIKRITFLRKVILNSNNISQY